MRILVVDDIFANRLLLSELIKSTGNEVVQAINGEEAIEQLKNQDIQLIFMDIEMPVMNGIETTEYIRRQMEEPFRSIPIIAVTAHNPTYFFADFAETGFNEVITKPYSISQVRQKIEALVT